MRINLFPKVNREAGRPGLGRVRPGFLATFRDAKQYWGLEDFMVVNQTPVYNSANFAMFMVNLSHAIMRSMRGHWPELSVIDLKAWFRSHKYVVETLKLLPEMPIPSPNSENEQNRGASEKSTD